MTYSIISLFLLLFAVALLAGVLLLLVAFVGGNVIHVWGTTSLMEWLSEALLRVFSGTLRRRLMRTINSQCSIGVDKSRRAHPFIAAAVSPLDVDKLTGPGNDLAGLATDAGRAYERHARSEGWAAGSSAPQVVVIHDELRRRGTVKVRPVSARDFHDLRREMAETDQGLDDVQIGTTPLTLVDDRVGQLLAQPVSGAELANPSELVTETLGDAEAVTVLAKPPSVRMVLRDTHGKQHAVKAAVALIGRGLECDIRVGSADVSREHADVYLQGGSWWLRDRGSRNGTSVDGRLVSGAGPVRLTQGSRIVLGGKSVGEMLVVADLDEG